MTMVPITPSIMQYELARAARWYRVVRRGDDFDEVDAYPPREVIADVLAQPDLPLPPMRVIVESPTFAPDGRLIATSGYDTSSGIYARLDGLNMPPVPDEPTEDDLSLARQWLDMMMAGFPFGGPAERAHAYALLVLPFVRPMIDGQTPLHMFEAPSAGTGKSLLVECLLRIGTGHPPATVAETRDEDEWRKRITSMLFAGDRAICMDNLTRKIEAPALVKALTDIVWRDRWMGGNTMVRVPVRCIWTATANNPTMSDEITRRTIRCRIDAKTDRPWLRDGFAIPDLRGWVLEHRAKLCWAVCTLVRAWQAAGCPGPEGGRELGSYREWSQIVGGVLYAAGIKGFLSNLVEMYDAGDVRGVAIRSLLAQWWQGRASMESTTSDVFSYAEGIDGLGIDAKSERGAQVKLSNLLRAIRDRVYDLGDGLQVRVERIPSPVSKRPGWRLIRSE